MTDTIHLNRKTAATIVRANEEHYGRQYTVGFYDRNNDILLFLDEGNIIFRKSMLTEIGPEFSNVTRFFVCLNNNRSKDFWYRVLPSILTM